MRVQVVDPSAYTPPYDRALCAALGRAGATVELVTSRFAYGEVPAADGYVVDELFYRYARGAPGSRGRRLAKLAEHVPDMLHFRRSAARADVVHLQWLTAPVIDLHLLPNRPLVLTAHDVLPREPRLGQLRAQRRLFDRVDAIVVHSQYGRRQLVERLDVAADRVHVIPHGAFEHMPASRRAPLPPELAPTAGVGPVVLFLGLLRPYKGLDTLLRAWRRVGGAQLWIVGRPMMPLEPLRALSTPGVHWVPRYVSEGEMAALLERADLLAVPYSRTERFDQSGVLASALAFGTPAVVSDIGGFSEVAETGAARLVAPDDPDALGAALADLIADPVARGRMAGAARAAAQGPYSWDESARRTLALYETLV